MSHVGTGARESSVLLVDGKSVSIDDATTVAAVLANAGIDAFRRSVTGDARGPLCAMGICHECRMTIDGIPHRRACLVIARPGMIVVTDTRS